MSLLNLKVFSKPVFKSSDLIRQFSDQHGIGIHRQTAFELLKRLRDAEMLQELRPDRGDLLRSFVFSGINSTAVEVISVKKILSSCRESIKLTGF